MITRYYLLNAQACDKKSYGMVVEDILASAQQLYNYTFYSG